MITDQAAEIVRRANALNLSITEVCKKAGVSRRWFEDFKHRLPKSIEAHLKLKQVLTELENDNKTVSR